MSPQERSGSSSSDSVSHSDALQRMYRISSDHEHPFENKLNDLLSLGCEYLNVQVGFLTEISDDTQRIVQTSGDHDLLQSGESCPLSDAYCRKTIHRDNALTVQHASVEGWEQDSAYELFGLESYIGAKVNVEGDLYGTFCFADDEPREHPFSTDEETFVELMASWVDYELTQKRAAERIEQHRDQLDNFASVLSHDIRNPLNVAQGRLGLAREECDSEHLDNVEQAHTRIENLIEDMLALSREGEQVGDFEQVAIADMIQRCWETVDTKQASVISNIDRMVQADKSRLQQLLENIIRNAIEHGGTEVTVSVGELSDGFYIEDDGPGIPENEYEEVFEMGHSTTNEGTGFGMSIVKQVANAHGWHVSVTESSNGGTRFEITGVEFDTEPST